MLDCVNGKNRVDPSVVSATLDYVNVELPEAEGLLLSKL